MQHTVQQQLIDELSQLRETLDSAEAPLPREKPAADPGGPRSALELARATQHRHKRDARKKRDGQANPVGELAQRILPLLDN